MTNHLRPTCIECNRELIFCAIAGPSMMIPSWVCDCELRPHPELAPEGLIAEIVRAREEGEVSLVFDLTILYPILGVEHD